MRGFRCGELFLLALCLLASGVSCHRQTNDNHSSLRPWPDTSSGIHVFSDQLSEGLSDAQIRFVASHYAGCQKMIRSEADRLRAVNPQFIILHYRLGIGLGFRETQGDCLPNGDWLRVIEGNEWVQEWPGDATVAENWFYHWPEADGPRVLQCGWGWFLVNPDDAAWWEFWQKEVQRQLTANDDDGLFLDSLSVPNYMGADQFRPRLPDQDEAFEAAWAQRIARWLQKLHERFAASYYIVPNVGAWINSRDRTDYGMAAGLMIEGFALEADQSPYPYSDWQLQMNRILAASRTQQSLLLQTYVSLDQERMFALGCYLLVKGSRSFFTIETGLEPEWWPEYGIAIGSPLAGPATAIAELDPENDSIYSRRFSAGLVLVNPTNPWDESAVTRTVDLGGTYYLCLGSGGGPLPESGIPDSGLAYRSVSSIILRPFSAAVLLNELPH
jgi:hypothetical protein